MANLTISAAASLVGKTRSTIHRYIQSGKLSASKDNAGVYTIDTAELSRVFGELELPQGRGVTTENENQAALVATIDILKEQLQAAQARENRLMAMLEQEQETRRALEQRLLPPGQSDWQELKPAPKKGFWASLFGR